jgi:hypothetical protein
MMDSDREGFVSVDFGNEVYIEKIVFRAANDIVAVEFPKIEAELMRQLETILREAEQKEAKVMNRSRLEGLSVDTIARLKRVMKQLFLHLQRILMLKIAQNLSERLTAQVTDLGEKVVGAEEEKERLEKEVKDLREKLRDFSKGIGESARKNDRQGDREEKAENLDYEKIGVSVDGLIRQTHQVTEMLTELCKKYLQTKEENSRLKEEGPV